MRTVGAGSSLDLDAYVARIGYAGPREASSDVLSALHLAHLGTIPFENVDVILGRRVALDLESLEAKLVRGRRGGYCFEQNTLFSAVLRLFGFEVSTLEARVRPPGATRSLPRTHMVLGVDLGDRAVLADVGFGGDGPLWPVDLSGEESLQVDDRYRVVEEGRLRVLQVHGGEQWRDLYAFSLEPALPVDFEMANHFTSTWPASPFTTTLTAQRSFAGERRILRDRTYTVRRGGTSETQEVADADLLPLLAERFGLVLPAVTRFPPPLRSLQPLRASAGGGDVAS